MLFNSIFRMRRSKALMESGPLAADHHEYTSSSRAHGPCNMNIPNPEKECTAQHPSKSFAIQLERRINGHKQHKCKPNY